MQHSSRVGLEHISGDLGFFAGVLDILELWDWCSFEQTATWASTAVVSILPTLRSARAEGNQEALRHCRAGNLTKLWASIDALVGPSPTSDILTDSVDDTLLHIAARAKPGEHSDRLFRWLLSRPGADVLARTINKQGQTPLHICARTHGRVPAARSLLDLPGVQVDLRDIYESTALINAVREEHPAAVALLLEHRADVNTFVPNCHGHGETPLVLAIRLRNLEIAQLLLKDRRTDLHQKTLDGVPFGKEAIDFAPSSGPLRRALERAIMVKRLTSPVTPENTGGSDLDASAELQSENSNIALHPWPPADKEAATPMNEESVKGLDSESIIEKPKAVRNSIAAWFAWCFA